MGDAEATATLLLLMGQAAPDGCRCVRARVSPGGRGRGPVSRPLRGRGHPRLDLGDLRPQPGILRPQPSVLRPQPAALVARVVALTQRVIALTPRVIALTPRCVALLARDLQRVPELLELRTRTRQATSPEAEKKKKKPRACLSVAPTDRGCTAQGAGGGGARAPWFATLGRAVARAAEHAHAVVVVLYQHLKPTRDAVAWDG